jgi:hypothetical protein
VAAGPVAEVLANGHRAGLLVRLADLEAGRAVLHRGRYPGSASRRWLARRRAASTGRHRDRDAASQGLYLTELRPDEADLEAVLLELTADPPLEVTR